MDDHIRIIRDDPLARRVAVNGHRRNAVVVPEPVAQLPGDRFQMRLRRARADDEKIREGGDAAQIEGEDVFGFFVGGVLRAEAGELFRFDGAAPGKGDVRR